MRGVKWGPQGNRIVKAESGWKEPEKWNRDAQQLEDVSRALMNSPIPLCTADIASRFHWQMRRTQAVLDDLAAAEIVIPNKGNLGGYCHSEDTRLRRPRVFCASLADVFELRELTEWAEICDGYRISFRGKIESQWRPGGHRAGWEQIKTRIDDGGYETVQLRKHPTLGDKTLKVHRLMLQAFLGDGEDGQVVRHLDGVRSNNVLWNLQYSSQSENLQDRIGHGTNIDGERNGRSKLNEADVIRIRELLSEGKSQSAIAAEFGVKQVAISRIKLGKSWSPKVALPTEVVRTCVPGQMIDSELRPLFITANGWTDCPEGDSREWMPLTMQDVRERLFRLIDETPNLDWLLLTKRPENIAKMMPEYFPGGYIAEAGTMNQEGPRPNLWLGVSVENQQTADERIPHLLRVPAAVRFLSAEPLLGRLELYARGWLTGRIPGQCGSCVICRHPVRCRCPGDGFPSIDWVIVGGESGPGARPCDVAWIRSIAQQCKAAGVACFVKQLGSHCHWDCDGLDDDMGYMAEQCEHAEPRFVLTDKKGGDPAEWPDDLRVREFPI